MFVILNPVNGELYRKTKDNATAQLYAHIEQASRPIRIIHVEGFIDMDEKLVLLMLKSMTGLSFNKWDINKARRYLSFLVERVAPVTFVPGNAILKAVENSDEDYIIESVNGTSGDIKPGSTPVIKMLHDVELVREMDNAKYSIRIQEVPKIELEVASPTPVKERAPRAERTLGNAVRPSRGVTLEIWNWLDDNPNADRAALKAHGIAAGWNNNTISVQYSAWKTANGK